MKKLLLAAAAVGLMAAHSGTQAAQSPTQAAQSILFIGNSLTYGAVSSVMFYRPETVHDLNPADFADSGMRAGPPEGRTLGGVPALFKALTREAGLNYDVSVETVGGSASGEF